jgi:hypothetical protein
MLSYLLFLLLGTLSFATFGILYAMKNMFNYLHACESLTLQIMPDAQPVGKFIFSWTKSLYMVGKYFCLYLWGIVLFLKWRVKAWYASKISICVTQSESKIGAVDWTKVEGISDALDRVNETTQLPVIALANMLLSRSPEIRKSLNNTSIYLDIMYNPQKMIYWVRLYCGAEPGYKIIFPNVSFKLVAGVSGKIFKRFAETFSVDAIAKVNDHSTKELIKRIGTNIALPPNLFPIALDYACYSPIN